MVVFCRQFHRFLPRQLFFGSRSKEELIGNATSSFQPLGGRSAQPPAHFECFTGMRRINSCILALRHAIEISGHFIVTAGGYLTTRIGAPILNHIIGIPDMKAQGL
jgi:hypothetical protein